MSDFDGPRRGFRRLLRLPGHRAQQIAREVDDELRFHLDMRAAELEAAGLSPDAARREAERRFGNLSDTQEYCRMMDRESARRERRRDWFADAWDDARWTVRQMARYPGFTLLAVITLAVGIGASTAIYSVVHRLLIDPLPLPGGERMVVLVRQSPTSPLKLTPSPQLIEAWRSVRSFEWVAALDQRHVVLGEGTDTATVTGGGFETAVPQRLRIRPVLGRFFADDEALPGAAPVAMLGYGLWQRRFGGDPGVIGRAVHIDGRPHTVIGVTPPEFELPFFSSTPESKDIWTPLVLDTTTVGVNGMAMLRPGATAEQAGHEMTAIMHDLGANDPLSRGLVAAALRPQDFLRSSTREMLLVTLGAVGVLLLIACTNVANLLLARSIGRQRELAVRQALGAGRGRLVRQLLTESGILSLAGGALGLWVAWRALAAIIALRPEELVALDRVRLDAGMLAGALVVAVVTGILFGLAPALLATDGGIGQALRQGTSGDGGHRRSTRLRSTFVTLEIALSVVLLVGAGLLVRSFVQMQRLELGIDPRGLMSLPLRLPADRYPTPQLQTEAFDEVIRRVTAIPGVQGADVALGLPAAAGATFGSLEIEGAPAEAAGAASAFGFNAVRPSFFRLVGLRVREGSVFSDDPAAPEMMINATMAARYWPGQSAVGRRLRLSKEGNWTTVIGVVDDVRLPGARGSISDHQIYAPFRDFSRGGTSETASGPVEDLVEAALVLRVNDAIPSVIPRVITTVTAVDPGITVGRLASMQSLIDAQFVRPRFSIALLGSFALLAMVVATVGLYGVIAFVVSRRSREMGIRLALGARPATVLRLVLGEGARLGLLGIALGVVGAAAGTRLMRGFIYGVSALDPLTFAVVAAMLVLVSLLASYGPARRAVRADPLEALRSD